MGTVIRRLRMANQLSQEELSERSGLDTKFISNIERDYQLPGFDSFCALAESFNMRGSELFKLIEDFNDKQRNL